MTEDTIDFDGMCKRLIEEGEFKVQRAKRIVADSHSGLTIEEIEAKYEVSIEIKVTESATHIVNKNE